MGDLNFQKPRPERVEHPGISFLQLFYTTRRDDDGHPKKLGIAERLQRGWNLARYYRQQVGDWFKKQKEKSVQGDPFDPDPFNRLPGSEAREAEEDKERLNRAEEVAEKIGEKAAEDETPAPEDPAQAWREANREAEAVAAEGAARAAETPSAAGDAGARERADAETAAPAETAGPESRDRELGDRGRRMAHDIAERRGVKAPAEEEEEAGAAVRADGAAEPVPENGAAGRPDGGMEM